MARIKQNRHQTRRGSGSPGVAEAVMSLPREAPRGTSHSCSKLAYESMRTKTSSDHGRDNDVLATFLTRCDTESPSSVRRCLSRGAQPSLVLQLSGSTATDSNPPEKANAACLLLPRAPETAAVVASSCQQRFGKEGHKQHPRAQPQANPSIKAHPQRHRFLTTLRHQPARLHKVSASRLEPKPNCFDAPREGLVSHHPCSCHDSPHAVCRRYRRKSPVNFRLARL